MSDTFQCPKCGAKYARERRRVGRAVVCSCGHKFLVPPPDDEPAAAGLPTATRPDDGGAYQGRTNESAASDSSSEVLPLAELADDDPAPARWAEPVEAEEVLPEAEIVYAVPVRPAAPVDDLFSSSGAYGGPPHALGGAEIGRFPPAAASAPPIKTHNARRKRNDRHTNVTDVIASIALFGLLPIGALFCVLGLVQYFRLGRLMPVEAQAAPGPPAFNGGFQPAPPMVRHTAGGMPILVVRVTKKPATDDFTLEYDVRHGALNPASQYVWVVSSLQGKIEFQIPTPAPGRGQISGRPAQAAGLSPPYTAYIEERSASGSTRVSNDVAVIIGG